MSWFKDGDKKYCLFFHSVMKKRTNASAIQKLVYNGQNLDDPSQIEKHILDFYTNLYADNAQANCSVLEMQHFVSKCIPSLVTEDENQKLIQCLGKEEIMCCV